MIFPRDWFVFPPGSCLAVLLLFPQPLDPTEAPPTEAEATLLKDARVVETVDDAASIHEKVPTYENGEPEAARKVDEAVEEIDSKKAKSSENGKPDVAGANKGWFGGWRG